MKLFVCVIVPGAATTITVDGTPISLLAGDAAADIVTKLVAGCPVTAEIDVAVVDTRVVGAIKASSAAGANSEILESVADVPAGIALSTLKTAVAAGVASAIAIL